MNLTETLRQALSTPASGHWPANPTCAERMVQRLIGLALGQDDVDAIRLIFERVDGPAPGRDEGRGMRDEPDGGQIDCLPLDHPEVEAIGRAVDPKDDGGTWLDD
jgi:hypothetical protein